MSDEYKPSTINNLRDLIARFHTEVGLPDEELFQFTETIDEIESELTQLRKENEELKEHGKAALNYLNVYMSENKATNSGRLRAIKVHLKSLEEK